MPIGIRNHFRLNNPIIVVNSIVGVPLVLPVTIGKNQFVKMRYWLPLQVGATGGIRINQVVATVSGPGIGITAVRHIGYLYNSVTGIVTIGNGGGGFPFGFTNALANSGIHSLIIESDYKNGSTSEFTIDLTVAQNTVDALSMNCMEGASIEVVKL